MTHAGLQAIAHCISLRYLSLIPGRSHSPLHFIELFVVNPVLKAIAHGISLRHLSLIPG